MEYKIVKEGSVWGLQLAVNGLVSEGWKPQGSLTIENGEYIQTMVRESDESHKEEVPDEPVLLEEEYDDEDDMSDESEEVYDEELDMDNNNDDDIYLVADEDNEEEINFDNEA